MGGLWRDEKEGMRSRVVVVVDNLKLTTPSPPHSLSLLPCNAALLDGGIGDPGKSGYTPNTGSARAAALRDVISCIRRH